MSAPDTEFRADDFLLNVRLVSNGPAPWVIGADTSDNCGSGNTGSNACTTNC
ncbi:FxLD family lantipeptide [Actinomadura craniellae]|uniref:FxLD family lantipeptide n=2 Tax=Actinomadura craniellae TaxID=2231787 RepID=A0A365HDZ0_9ACTN|nr:FxLD family lantipeptide [Actinomadura craniellae]